MKNVKISALIFCLLFFQLCNETNSERCCDEYSFKLKTFKYPPYNSIFEGKIDTLFGGDSMILSVEIVRESNLQKVANSTGINKNPVSPNIIDDQTSIICSNMIVVESDTISAGTNLYPHIVRDRVSSVEYKNYAGAIYFSGKCKFIDGDNIFKLQTVDNFEKTHYDACTIFVK